MAEKNSCKSYSMATQTYMPKAKVHNPLPKGGPTAKPMSKSAMVNRVSCPNCGHSVPIPTGGSGYGG